mgnify:CR=1 FL=1
MGDQSFEKIKNYILESNLIDEAKLSDILVKAQQSGVDPQELLVTSGLITSSQLISIKSKIFNLPIADLSESEVSQSTLNILSQKAAENYKMVVFGQEGRAIKVGLVDPGNFLAIEAMDFLAKQDGWKPRYYVISPIDFRRIMKQYGESKKEIATALESAEEKFSSKEKIILQKQDESSIEERIKSAPVAKIVSVIIRNAVDGGASDVHIEPGKNESRVRYRVDGALHTSLNVPNYLHNAVISRIKVLANLKLDETRVPQDGRIRLVVDGKDVDLRVSVLPMLNSEKVVIRVLNTSAGVPTLKQLGFSDYHIETIERNIKRPFGLFLLTGPTGSGKTTTLYSILNILKSDDSNITTLEDPIEYYVSGVNQSQINPEVGFSFASGLRAILRQDPNIIMVGEIRDNETAELVIHAGLTGHLVFSTLHTNNAWGAIPRLVDMHAEPFLLASTLNLVMAQRLVRKICPDCKEEVELPPALFSKIEQEFSKIPENLRNDIKKLQFFRGKGCSSCANSGYIGRTIVGELLEVTPDLRELIAKENFSGEALERQFKKQNYVNLMQDGLIKVVQGITTIDEVMRVTQN